MAQVPPSGVKPSRKAPPRAVPKVARKPKRSRTTLLFGVLAGSPFYALGAVLCWMALQEPVDAEPVPSLVPTIAAIAPYVEVSGPPGPTKKIPTAERSQGAARELPEAAPVGGPPSLVWPGDSAIVTSGFGVRIDPVAHLDTRVHRGIDVRSPLGAPVLSAADGLVVYASNGTGGGLMVKVVHGDSLSTAYMHLSRADVSVGDHVKAGDRLGASGTSGRSTGPHLHFEVWENGVALDPLAFRWHAPNQAASDRLAGAVARSY